MESQINVAHSKNKKKIKKINK